MGAPTKAEISEDADPALAGGASGQGGLPSRVATPLRAARRTPRRQRSSTPAIARYVHLARFGRVERLRSFVPPAVGVIAGAVLAALLARQFGA